MAEVEGLGEETRVAIRVLELKGDVVENENKVLSFVGYLGWLGASSATLKQAIFAIKDGHKKAGAGDPTEGMCRLWILASNGSQGCSQTPSPGRHATDAGVDGTAPGGPLV